MLLGSLLPECESKGNGPVEEEEELDEGLVVEDVGGSRVNGTDDFSVLVRREGDLG